MKPRSGSRARESSPVRVQVTGRHMVVTPALEAYVVKKMAKLDRYLDRLSDVNITLGSGNSHRTGERHLAEATALVKGRPLHAQCVDADMYAAVDGLVDKLHHQLTRLKERAREHKTSVAPPTEETLSTLDDLPLDDASTSSPRIVEVKQYAMKPLFPDEAIDEMEELGHTFYVFLSAETERVNVVYRRSDGRFGLIKPAFD